MGNTICATGYMLSPITLSVHLADNSTTTATFLTCVADNSLAISRGAIIGLAVGLSILVPILIVFAIAWWNACWNKRAKERELRVIEQAVQAVMDREARQLQALQDDIPIQNFDPV